MLSGTTRRCLTLIAFGVGLFSLPAHAQSVIGSIVTSGDGSHIIFPNGCNNLALVITNSAGTPMTGISATLSTTNQAVLITQPYATYPNIPAHSTGTNLAPFQISTLSNYPPNTLINLSLSINSSLGSVMMNFAQSVGISAVPLEYVFLGLIGPPPPSDVFNIPDIGSVTASNIIASWTGGPISKVTVSLWLIAPYSSDMTLTVISPDGTTVNLASNVGGGADFGSGTAAASRTTFDDSAPIAITAGASPFVGTFRPQSPLSAFIGTSPVGAWRLRVVDSFASGSPDTVRISLLSLSGTVSITNTGNCDLCMPPITNAIAFGDPAQSGHWSNGIVASCGAPKTWSGTVAGTFRYRIHTFTNTSPVAACVTVELSSPSNLLATAYLTSFNPASITLNYLGDAGRSTFSGPTTFSCTVPAGATFQVVVTEVTAETTTKPYTLQLSGLPCPPPTLSIQPIAPNQSRLFWSTAAGGYLLESKTNLAASAWVAVTNEPIVAALKYNVTNSTSSPTNLFYRLHRP